MVSAGTMVTDDSVATVNKVIEYHSSCYRLKLSVAVFLRIKTVLQKRKEVKRPISFESDPHCQATNAKPSKAETSGIVHRCTALTV